MSRARALQMEPTVAPRTRTRTRSGATPEMIALAQQAIAANKTANAASSQSRKDTKALHKLMSQAGVSQFQFEAEFNGASFPAEAVIAPIAVDVISVEKLRALVDDDTFMKIVKATKGAVEEHAGTHIAIQTTVTEERPADLKIKEVK
jgi:hypothetical protein